MKVSLNYVSGCSRSGIRPLAVDPNAKDTASASRDHIVTTDPDGMITVTGRVLKLCI